MPRAFLIVATVLVASAVGCGKNIGDPCKTNVDCSPSGDRFCDTASPGGYCTVDGCDDQTCPGDDVVCVRFLTAVLDRTCVFGAPFPDHGCRVDERCVCDTSTTEQGCIDGRAHCAPEASERRWCMDRCNSNGDCRAEYECRTTGTFGAEPVPERITGVIKAAKFCVPK